MDTVLSCFIQLPFCGQSVSLWRWKKTRQSCTDFAHIIYQSLVFYKLFASKTLVSSKNLEQSPSIPSPSSEKKKRHINTQLLSVSLHHKLSYVVYNPWLLSFKPMIGYPRGFNHGCFIVSYEKSQPGSASSRAPTWWDLNSWRCRSSARSLFSR